MREFILCGIVCTIGVGSWFGLIATQLTQRKIVKIFIGFIIACAIGFGISGLMAFNKKIDKEHWNNGICQCGGEFELKDIEHIRNSSGRCYYERYYYQCKECKKIIKTDSNMQN